MKKFLYDHAVTSRPHGMLDQYAVYRPVSLHHAGCDNDAFPRRKSVGLHDDGRSLRIHVLVCGPGFAETRICRGGNAVARHEFLGELLRAFQLRASLGRAEYAKRLRAKQVHDSFGERSLGTDHGEMDLLRDCELGELVDCANCNVLQSRFARGAAVSRGNVDFLHARALREAPGDRVLPAA
jgi:hypothetical protein